MVYEYPLTILTPTYNRAKCLKRIYESLKNQTDQDFQWLLIDDGSTDETSDVVKDFDKQDFSFDYVKKSNGGKHTALNYSHPYIKGALVCIVDSDDYLLPSAVERIIECKNEYFVNKNVRLLSFLRGRDSEDAICKSFPKKPVISNHIDFRVNGRRGGDCCEVIDTDVFKEWPFPEYEKERFLGEGYLWNNTGFKYDTVYIPEIIYICEYLDGGLTDSGRRLRISCPYGGMANSNSFFGSGNGRVVNDRMLKKEAWLYVCYGKFAGLKRKAIVESCTRPDLIRKNYIYGFALYVYWKLKYRKGK
ncbi:MAG: glycosyltransferase family 2 protein [Lachnospiraceae bacterium]|nr:glycosyltransferase family 2 protein [Lachnospiraceae bacterium]